MRTAIPTVKINQSPQNKVTEMPTSKKRR
jgi:hypothetical protein